MEMTQQARAAIHALLCYMAHDEGCPGEVDDDRCLCGYTYAIKRAREVLATLAQRGDVGSPRCSGHEGAGVMAQTEAQKQRRCASRAQAVARYLCKKDGLEPDALVPAGSFNGVPICPPYAAWKRYHKEAMHIVRIVETADYQRRLRYNAGKANAP